MRHFIVSLLTAGLFLSTIARVVADTSSTLLITSKAGQFQGIAPDPAVRAWLGIPYASPPVGALRFMPAKAIPTSLQIFQATNFSQSCIQSEAIVAKFKKYVAFDTVTEGEDCLSLNIWAPSTDRPKSNGAAVLIWFGATGLTTGVTDFSQYHGDLFVKNQDDLIVVTVNSRLNIFGFPQTPLIEDAQQNAGLSDQRLAVEWIRDNIASFGGDPARITISGNVVGGASVGVWNYAYKQDPIIAGAIQASGHETIGFSVFGPGKTLAERTLIWNTVATKANCSLDIISSGPKAAGLNQLACMQAVEWKRIKSIISAGLESDYRPVQNNIQFFSPETLLTSARAGQFAKTPTLLGNNNDEVSIALGGRSATADSLTQQLYTCATARTALFRGEHASVHRYRYSGEWANINRVGDLGAAQLFDLSMVFGTYNRSVSPTMNGVALPRIDSTAAEIQTSAAMQGLWASFVRNPSSGLNSTSWPVYSPSTNSLAVFGAKSVPVAYVKGDTYDSGCVLYQH